MLAHVPMSHHFQCEQLLGNTLEIIFHVSLVAKRILSHPKFCQILEALKLVEEFASSQWVLSTTGLSILQLPVEHLSCFRHCLSASN